MREDRTKSFMEHLTTVFVGGFRHVVEEWRARRFFVVATGVVSWFRSRLLIAASSLSILLAVFIRAGPSTKLHSLSFGRKHRAGKDIVCSALFSFQS